MEAVNIISLIIAFVSINFSILTYFFSVSYNKKRATLDAYNALQEQVLDEIYNYKKSEIIDISKDKQSSAYKHTTVMLARIEHFCVGVNTKVYDKKIVKRLAGKYFIGIYDKMCPLITEKRNSNKTDKHYDEFEKLALEIKSMYK